MCIGKNPLLPITLTCANMNDRKQKDAMEQTIDMMKQDKVIQDNINKANEKYKLKAN